MKFAKSIARFVSSFRTAVAEYQIFAGTLSSQELAGIALLELPKEVHFLRATLRREASTSVSKMVELETVMTTLFFIDAQFPSDRTKLIREQALSLLP